MKKLYSRLRGSRGESLIESLAAILVFTLSSIIFLTMVTSANNINRTVKDEYAAFQEQRQAIENVTPTSPTAELTISCKEGGTTTITVQQVTADGLTAFYPTVPTVPGGEG